MSFRIDYETKRIHVIDAASMAMIVRNIERRAMDLFDFEVICNCLSREEAMEQAIEYLKAEKPDGIQTALPYHEFPPTPDDFCLN